MEKTSNIAEARDTFAKGIQWLQVVFEHIEAFLKKVSAILIKATGIIICLGGLAATIGWLIASLHPDPLGPTWGLSIWLVIAGVFAIVIGVMALSAQYMLRIGVIGQYGIMFFLLGALILIV